VIISPSAAKEDEVMEELATTEKPKSMVNASQFLTFSLGEEEYGIELLKVQEIKGYSAITPIPNSPAHIKGVMNLRGAVIPIVDLRIRFGMEAVNYTKFHVIIVINVGTKVMGLLVDAVSDVLTVAPDDIRPAPDFGTHADTRFISGMASAGDKVAVLLELETLLREADLAVTGDVPNNVSNDVNDNETAAATEAS
jgi:purine-binding chemotaxis protein CheW